MSAQGVIRSGWRRNKTARRSGPGGISICLVKNGVRCPKKEAAKACTREHYFHCVAAEAQNLTRVSMGDSNLPQERSLTQNFDHPCLLLLTQASAKSRHPEFAIPSVNQRTA